MSDYPPPPWTPCSCGTGCDACYQLGLLLPSTPDAWVDSSWMLSFASPHAKDDALALLFLREIYPHGGFRILPASHPAFSHVTAKLQEILDAQGTPAEFVPHTPYFRLRQTATPDAPIVTFRLAVVLLEQLPSRPIPTSV